MLQEEVMNVDLYYYTGTGNSLWATRTLAGYLGITDIIPMAADHAPGTKRQTENVGIIFPVHVWGLPRRVIEFINALPRQSNTYYFAVAVNAGQVAATLLQLKALMASRDMKLSAGFDLVMPSNYIPWGGPGPKDKQQIKFMAAQEKIGHIADIVDNREIRPVEKGPLWQNMLFSYLYRMIFPRIPGMDKSFRADEKCNACRVCQSICPCGNIEMDTDNKPIWNHHCEQCLACLQWCPQEAIQFGKRTLRYERYHHPEIRLRDMIMDSSKNLQAKPPSA